MRKKYSHEIKLRAKSMYSSHHTYGEISDVLGVPKSTLSSWLGTRMSAKFGSREWLNHLAAIRTLAGNARRSMREAHEMHAKESATTTVRTLPFRDRAFVLSLLGMLYWSEGGRHYGVSGIRFTNTDPDMIRLFLSLYRRAYAIAASEITLQVQCHPYHDSVKVRSFWASLAHIPSKQVQLLIIQKRGVSKRYRKNFMGICQLRLPNVARRREIMAVANRIAMWYNTDTNDGTLP